MTISKAAHIERVLIAFNDDGTVRGAHQETLERVMEDGAQLSAKYLPAAPITAAALTGLFGLQAASLVASVDAQARSIATLTAERDQAIADRDSLAQRVSDLTLEKEALAAALAAAQGAP